MEQEPSVTAHVEDPKSVSAIRATLGLLPLIAFSTAFAEPTAAQTAAEPIRLNEINVVDQAHGYRVNNLSSPTATAPILNTPQSVTVIPRQILDEQAVTDFVGALRNTPGISIDAGENAFGSGGNSIFLRGMNTTGSIFSDGFRSNGSYSRDIFNVDRIEVVRGPSSDEGRGSGAGYINMVTRTPLLENFARGGLLFGFDDEGRNRTRSTIDLNRHAGNAAIRLNAMIEGGDVLTRDVANSRAWGVAPSITLGIGTPFRATFAYEHYQRNDLPDSGVVVNRAAPAKGVGIHDAGPRSYVRNLPRDTFFGARTDYDDVRSDTLLSRLEYEISANATVSNVTRWSRVDRNAVYRIPDATAPRLPLPDNSPLGRQYYDRTNDSLGNRTNLSVRFATGPLQHSLSTGIELNREESTARRGGSLTNNSSVRVNTVAGYLNDSIRLSERWMISAGARIERYETTINASAGDIPGASGSRFSDSRTLASGRVGIIFKPRPEGSIYAAYGLAQLPHGGLLSNPDISRTGGNAFPGFIAGADPVETQNYELGIKWDFLGGGLSLGAALFRSERRNVGYVRGPNSLPGDPAIMYGRQVVQGIELEAVGAITPAWSVFAGLTILDTERRHGAAVDRALSGDYTANGTYFGAVRSTNGNQLAFAPDVTANFWTTYRFDNGLTLGGGFRYVSESYVGRPDDALRVIPNGKFGKLPGYFLANLMASYRVTDNVTVTANIDNLTDETYLTTTNWNASWGYLGAGRTYRVGASFRF
nr:TonB-dependent receptor [uncultured Roseococcus sp.]